MITDDSNNFARQYFGTNNSPHGPTTRPRYMKSFLAWPNLRLCLRIRLQSCAVSRSLGTENYLPLHQELAYLRVCHPMLVFSLTSAVSWWPPVPTRFDSLVTTGFDSIFPIQLDPLVPTQFESLVPTGFDFQLDSTSYLMRLLIWFDSLFCLNLTERFLFDLTHLTPLFLYDLTQV